MPSYFPHMTVDEAINHHHLRRKNISDEAAEKLDQRILEAVANHAKTRGEISRKTGILPVVVSRRLVKLREYKKIGIDSDGRVTMINPIMEESC